MFLYAASLRQSARRGSSLRCSGTGIGPRHRNRKGLTMNFRALISASLLSAIAVSAFAQTETPRVDQREAHQQARIAQGAASGALTGRETRRLEREQHAIGKAEARAKADGSVTKQERKRLHHMQNHASRDIARQKHDAQKPAPGN